MTFIMQGFMPFAWLYFGLVCLVVFKILDEIPDYGRACLNLWCRRYLLLLFFISFGVWFWQNKH